MKVWNIVNYQEALAYLYSLSDYERGGPFTRNPEENLAREARLLEALGNPQLSYSSTLIAGTKGKGSTAAFIERVLREAGLRTGLYTQPDLHTFRERIRVDGHLISEDEVAELVPAVRAAVEEIERRREFGPFITYEVATALALLHFSRQRVEHAVLEVGLGGRLDATNVTQPLVSVIASISYDHMQILGDTLTEIATEKAGIIKLNGTVVTAEHQYFTVWKPEKVYTGLEIPLAGQHQLENATLAVATLDILRQKGVSWDEQALREGLRKIRWPARIDVVEHKPTIVVDGAHNADSMEKLMQALRDSFVFQRLIVVLSLFRDKDLVGIARALEHVDVVTLTRMASPRAATIERMREAFAKDAPQVEVRTADDSRAAMDLALTLAGSDDLICATGSLYFAAKVLRWAAARGDEVAAAAIESVDH